ncbi:hypothetical protein CRBSH125_01750 [Afipia carboxidovorans]|nr:hypothetical protein CRBSH125_01750 [Afipia carboxidovorans]
MQVTDEMVAKAVETYTAKCGGWYTAGTNPMRAALSAAFAAMWRPISEAPKDGQRILAIYGGQTRIVQYAKTSHVPLYGFCLADQGPEDFDIVPESKIAGWQTLPSPPAQEG